MRPFSLSTLLLALVIGAAAGCASLAPAPRAPLAATAGVADTFGFSGRIALREQDSNLAGGIRWSHDQAGDDILLSSPLGQGLMQIQTGSDGATLRTADGNFYRAADAEELAWKVTGWRIPVSGLAFWVRGLAQPGSVAHEERDDRGRLLNLRQHDWQIEYAAYFDAPNALLPRRIVLSRPQFELKLVVDSWEHPAGDTSAPSSIAH